MRHYKAEFATIESLSDEEKRQVNSDMLENILSFGDRSVSGKSIAQILTFKTAGVWYYHKPRIYFKMVNRELDIRKLQKNLIGAQIATIYTNRNGIKSSYLNIPTVNFVFSKKNLLSSISLVSIAHYAFTAFVRLLKSLAFSSKKRDQKQFACIDNITHYRRMLGLDGLQPIIENSYLGYLFQKKGDEFGFIDQVALPKLLSKQKFRFNLHLVRNFNDRKRYYGERIMLSALFSPSVWKEFLRARRQIQKGVEQIHNNLNDRQIFQRILISFADLNASTNYYLFKYLAYIKFFGETSFKGILSIDEYSPNNKIILDAAKNNGIRTMAYQHGNIFDLHVGYNYSTKDQSINPIPDTTVTWGKRWHNQLMKKGRYPANRLQIAGQLRTDIIPALRAMNEPKINALNTLPVQKKLVMYASQPQRDSDSRYRAAKDMITAAKAIDDLHLIIKLHPREDDSELYTKLADKYHLTRYTICKDEELYLLLQVSDIVVTCFSTVGIEAIFFNKPLIILDHLKQDVLSLHKDGIAIQATSAKELIETINGILRGKLVISEADYQHYQMEMGFKIDGKASDRLWEIINLEN
jgi:hypothetical protein